MVTQTRRNNRWKLIGFVIRAAITVGVIGLLVFAGTLVAGQFNQQPATPRAPSAGGPAPVIETEKMGGVEGFVLSVYLSMQEGELNKPAGDDDTPVQFTVEEGELVANIAERLEQEGLITNAGLFRNYVRYHGLDSRIEAGNFTLNQTMTIPDIARTLGHAFADEVIVRVTEGWRMEQIAEVVSDTVGLSITADAFLDLARTGEFDYDFLADRPDGATLEGFLFPDTYRVHRDATAEDLINLMLATFDERVTPDIREGLADQGLSVYEGVTLASIVEREAVVTNERPLIASVYLNRLDIGMKLDADPTVQYALGYQEDTGEWWKRPLLLVDLEVDSPYNTYKNPTLPPGPIANPGLESIRAVAEPANTEFMFFQAECDQSGKHRFARTFEEHLANNCQ
jgi:UPF0755 protein